MTGRTSSPAWNLWKPFTCWSIEENSFRDLTSYDDIASYIADQDAARYDFYILLHWGELFQGSYTEFKIWTMISLLYSGPRYGSVQFMFSREKLCKLSRTFQMYNRQFIQFASIPVEFVARLWDMSTQKYNNFSIAAAVILGYLLLKSRPSLKTQPSFEKTRIELQQPDWFFARNQSNRTIFDRPNKPGWIYKR